MRAGMQTLIIAEYLGPKRAKRRDLGALLEQNRTDYRLLNCGHLNCQHFEWRHFELPPPELPPRNYHRLKLPPP